MFIIDINNILRFIIILTYINYITNMLRSDTSENIVITDKDVA